MFRRRNPDPEPQPASDWDPNEIRTALFKVLDSRLGKENGKIIREDFEKHLAADSVHGVEQAYVCLVGKLIEYADALTEQSALGSLLGGTAATSGSAEIAGLNEFSVFRKEP